MHVVDDCGPGEGAGLNVCGLKKWLFFLSDAVRHL